jgi:hypothetical protein
LPVVKAFTLANATPRLLRADFDLGMPYVVVPSTHIFVMFESSGTSRRLGWDGFYFQTDATSVPAPLTTHTISAKVWRRVARRMRRSALSGPRRAGIDRTLQGLLLPSPAPVPQPHGVPSTDKRSPQAPWTFVRDKLHDAAFKTGASGEAGERTGAAHGANNTVPLHAFRVRVVNRTDSLVMG